MNNSKKNYQIAIITILISLFCLPVFASFYPDLYLRDAVSLNGEWRYHVDPYEIGYYNYRWQAHDQAENPSRGAYFMDVRPRDKQELIEYNFDAADTIQVPGDWNTQKTKLYYYEGTLWYRKTFKLDKLPRNQRAFLYFGAANYRADVYLNGKKLGKHLGGFSPFSFEATQQLVAGNNSLVVRVDNKRYQTAVPTLNTDWWNYGGLTREVRLVKVPKRFITQHRLHLERGTQNSIRGDVQLSDAVENQTVTLRIAELNISVRAKTNAEGVASFHFSADKLVRWSPENPKLYRIEIETKSDRISEQMGFRSLETRGKQVLLNGEPIYMRGISVHEELALNGGGRVKTEQEARQLLTWAKQLNANFLRLAHYPHNQHMVRLAEEMGFLVWSEVPVYWTISWENDATYQNAEQQLEDMIRRDYNRAAIIIWSLANETPVGDARNQFLSRLIKKARAMDDSRLLSAAMERHWKNSDNKLAISVVEDPIAEQLDIVSFNQYIGWYDGLPEKLARVSWQIPYDKPVFVSEFGAGAKQGHFGPASHRWTEEFQADLYAKTVAMLDNIDGLVGFSPWILSDFRSPRRVLPVIQDDFNRKGLISEDGIKKKAFFVLRDFYRKKSKQ